MVLAQRTSPAITAALTVEGRQLQLVVGGTFEPDQVVGTTLVSLDPPTAARSCAMTTGTTTTGTRTTGSTAGAVTGRPRTVLRLEGAVLLLAALVGYAATDEPWWLVSLVLLPDLLMAGYAHSTRVGALTYNLAHSYPIPAVLGGVGLWTGSGLTQALALVWFAHIGMDRALGYGLKHDDGFTHTHLGTIGRRP